MRICKAAIVAISLAVPAAASADTGGEAGIDPIMETYAGIAQAMYEDSAAGARTLGEAVDTLIAEPTERTLAAARQAWKAARVPYQQSEGFRYGNPIVDDWEGRVNAWPLDEGFIDYVAPAYGERAEENPLYRLNIIASDTLRIGPRLIDASTISKELLAGDLHEAFNVEANVATGYHAIEFLLWGQDLNGTGPGAGARPATDFDPRNCTGGHCARRVAYLQAATELLIADLDEMAANWRPDGPARAMLAAREPAARLGTILTGLSLLSYGELAGERLRLGLVLHDPEEEHDCFSDNTHNSHYYNQVGMTAIYRASYRRTDGSAVEGPSLSAYASERAPAEAAALEAAMDAAYDALRTLKETADSGEMAYDQMIGADNPEGNRMVQAAVDALVAQATAIWALAAALELPIQIEGSEILEN